MWIEQAIFTSRRGLARDGYQLAAASPGLASEDARALSQWGPAHDSLREDTPLAESIQFHPLPSGSWCVARTHCQGLEYSGRGGSCIWTHSLIVSDEVLRRFAYHPFRILDAVTAAGTEVELKTDRLPQLTLCGRGSPTTPHRLALLGKSPGFARLAELLQAALRPAPVAVVTRQAASSVFRGLFDLIPLEQRTAISFATGLRFSPRRPFHLLGLEAAPPTECRQVARAGMAVLDLAGTDPPDQPTDAWPRQVLELLQLGQLGMLDSLLRARLEAAEGSEGRLQPSAP